MQQYTPPSSSALNVIVFFTDGMPNGVVAQYSVLPTSGCQSLPLAPGVIAQWNGGLGDSGTTAGVLRPTIAGGISDTSSPLITPAPGCAFTVHNDATLMRQDVAYIPFQDYYGNSTQGGFIDNSAYLVSPGPGYRVDAPTSVIYASFNAADSQATAIRNDPMQPIIYAIGLGGATDLHGDFTLVDEFLHRVVNDRQSSIYDSSKPTGLFVYSPDTSQLAAAFRQIASVVLHLSK